MREKAEEMCASFLENSCVQGEGADYAMQNIFAQFFSEWIYHRYC